MLVDDIGDVSITNDGFFIIHFLNLKIQILFLNLYIIFQKKKISKGATILR